jgi:hypothetical protein
MVDPNEPVPPVIVTTEPEIIFFDKKYLYLCYFHNNASAFDYSLVARSRGQVGEHVE